MVFSEDHGRVRLDSEHGPCRLNEAQWGQLLDIFEAAGAKGLFNALYQAGSLAGFIPRCNSFRKDAA